MGRSTETYTGSRWKPRVSERWDGSRWEPVDTEIHDGTKWTAGAAGVPDPGSTLSFAGSSVWAAGFQNTVAISPTGTPDVVMIGGDTAGLHRSTDGGNFWRLSNAAATQLAQLKCASVYYHPTVAGKVYCYLSNAGGTSAWFGVSTDYGATWTYRLIPTGPGTEVGGDAHPRHTGRMIAAKGSTVALATGTDGVWKTTDDGVTWVDSAPVRLTGGTCTGIDVDPNAADMTVYVTVDGGTPGAGLYRITGFDATPSAATELGSLTNPQEVVCVNEGGTTVAYIAGGTQGVYKVTGAGSPVSISTATLTPSSGSPIWAAIDAVRSGASTIIYLGAVNPGLVSTGFYGCIYKSTNGGTSWAAAPSGTAAIKKTEWDASGATWWLSVAKSSMMLGKDGYDTAQIAIDRQNVDHVIVAGRSGVWHSADAGVNWYPAVEGIGASVGRLPAVDPTDDTRVALADVDWDLLTSTDRFVSQPTNSPPDNTGLSAEFTSAGKLFVGFGDRDANTEGKVWSNTAPFTGGTWVQETVPGSNGWPAAPGRVMGVLPHVNAAAAQTIFAGVRGNGLYRKTGSTWTQVNATIAGTGTAANKEQVNFHANGQYVYVYDPLLGLYRSDAYGDSGSWTQVWAKVTGSVRHAGHMQGVGNDLIVSTASEVWVVKDASTGLLNANGTTASGAIAATQLASSTLTKPGPITVSPTGDLYVTMVQGATALMRADGPISDFTASTAFTDLANDDYRRACGFPLGIAVGQDNTIYLSLDGNGHYVGRWT